MNYSVGNSFFELKLQQGLSFQETTHKILGIVGNSKENDAKQRYHDASKHDIRNAMGGMPMQEKRKANSWYNMGCNL